MTLKVGRRTSTWADSYLRRAQGRRAGAQAGGPSPPPPWSVRKGRTGSVATVAAVAVVIGLVTFALRALVLQHSFEVQVDEPIYLRISQNVADHLRLQYDVGGRAWPFFLHPPLFFVIEAAYLKIIGPSGDPIRLITDVRFLVAAFGAVSASTLFLLCRRVVGTWAGVAAALLFAIEPFVILMDSRNLLEASAALWMLLGLLLIVSFAADLEGTGATARTRRRIASRRRWARPPAAPVAAPWWQRVRWRLWLAGLAFGAAVLTNEPIAFVTLLPVALAACLGVIPRRAGALVIVVAVAVYAIYPGTVFLTGNWAQFSYQTFQGLGRFVGVISVTGFNSPEGPSFVAAVIDKVSVFGTTDTVLALGVPATILLALQRRRRLRIVACWSASAYLLQGYNILFGTNEEQYFYYPVVLAILAIVVAASLRMPSLRSTADAGRLRWFATLLFLAIFVAWSSSFEVSRYLTPDDGESHLLAFVAGQLAPGSRIAATNPTDAILLQESGYRVTNLAQVTAEPPTRVHDPGAITARHPDYVVVETQLIATNYGIGTSGLLAWLNENAQLVYAFRGPTDGALLVYRLRKGPGT